MMRDKCEASGLRVKPNADGRGHCPLCGDDWHCLTRDGRLRFHQRIHAATAEQIETIRQVQIRQLVSVGYVWSGWQSAAAG